NISDLTINAGTFYLVLEDANDLNKTGGNYRFSLDFNTTGDTYIDILSSDILHNITVNGGVIDDSLFGKDDEGGDIDFIDITITQRSILTFTHEGIISRISLYYPDGTLMNVSTDEDSRTFATEISAGNYKVKIDGFAPTQNGDYKITLNTSAVEDIVIDNGLSKTDIDEIVDVQYLGRYIYTLTKNGISKYTHLLLEKSKFETNFELNTNISNQTNHKLFIYNTNEENKVINYVVTTDLSHLKPIVSSLKMDTLDTTSKEIESLTSNNVNEDGYILPYLDIKHISSNRILYMYDGTTLQLRNSKDNTNEMRSYPIGSFANIETSSISENTDIAYITSNNNGGYLSIVKVDTEPFNINSSFSTIQLNGFVSGLEIDEKNNLLLIGVENEIRVYDISDRTNPIYTEKYYSFKDSEYKGTPSSIYKRDDRIYLIIPAKGIIILNIDTQNNISLNTTILNLGQYIDNIFSADGRTVNYTSIENNTTRLKIYFFEDTFSDGESDSILSGVKGNTPKEGCFIATAAYGSYFEKDVKVLRDFRDNILLTNIIGEEFVSLYYKYSPSIATTIAQNEFLKTIIRTLLTPIVYIIKYPLYSIFFILLLGVLRFEYLKRKGVLI
ncbi:MAG: hypothetical protein KAJ49_08350, partial [Arcobacteraceae bacterium]|nr:hypothetical protein [Arcobacteraceae bacterium]